MGCFRKSRKGLSHLINKAKLEKLYAKYNRREYVHPDPLEVLYRYDDISDREIVGMLASSLAYGRVAQIIKSVASVLDKMPSPSVFLKRTSLKTLRQAFKGFKHRFTTGDDIAVMLYRVKCAIEEYGSLENCFIKGLNIDDKTTLPALSKFVNKLTSYACNEENHLLPCPADGSACKRLNLFLRWMVRRDEVDPGGWYNVPASKLVVPLDIHMHRICLGMGLTDRKQPDLRTACEITSSFRGIAPDDPVRYDFCLTRLGIHKVWGGGDILAEYAASEVKRHA